MSELLVFRPDKKKVLYPCQEDDKIISSRDSCASGRLNMTQIKRRLAV